MATTSTTAAASTGGTGGVDPISAGIGAATAIAQTIAGINDMNKRRQFEASVALLDNRQRSELNKQLAAASTQSDRMAILSGSMVQFAIANENAAAKRETVMYIIAGSMAAVLLTVAVIISVKSKK